MVTAMVWQQLRDQISLGSNNNGSISHDDI